MIEGPGQANFDLAVSKAIALDWPHEKSSVQLRAEFFNAFNHPQFANPDTNFSSPTCGVISSTAANARVGQLALRFSFYYSPRSSKAIRMREWRRNHFFTCGGYFFRSFSTALLMFFCFFSGLALGSSVFEADPLQTNCFAAGSYMLTSNWPTYTVDVEP